MRREGGYLFVVTALIIGLGLGLLISLVISPVNYQNVSPSMLNPADKDLYRAMIALSFNARGDMGRAQARLGLLEDENPQVGLAAQAQQSIAQGKPAEEAAAWLCWQPLWVRPAPCDFTRRTRPHRTAIDPVLS